MIGGRADQMFDKILIANRGEIALRILRAAKELGIATVAVHSTADADAMHVRLADESVCIGPPPARDSYLNIPTLIAACEITGADAVHPGYGFLSENARFAEVLASHHITFIGPKAEHIRTMGDKIEAKRTAKRLGIPCVPGSEGGVTDEAEARKIAAEIGYPVLIKAAAGGGGRGMKVARSEEDLAACARHRADRGDGRLRRRRGLHREVPGKAAPHRDPGARATATAMRSISASATARSSAGIRRSGRKAPPRPSTPPSASASAASSRRRCGSCRYAGAGTVEFLYEDGQFYFIEMNTRIQVEHPVTEMITGIDLVNEQIKVAAGSPISVKQDELPIEGHAIECRINAEHPSTFRPSPGQITYFHPPGGLGVRVDSAVYQGYTIPPYYDSLVGKLIVHGRTRNECLMRLRRSLDEFVVDGVDTTLPLFRTLVRNPDVQNGTYDIHWLETFLKTGGIEES